ncbi:MAG: PQQ-dependent sugar dehydrogenase [Dehalococcoidia bacterium]|nr:PQQ-dependent sugar dehydrogenase [Dehalococcoidia bacterium]
MSPRPVLIGSLLTVLLALAAFSVTALLLRAGDDEAQPRAPALPTPTPAPGDGATPTTSTETPGTPATPTPVTAEVPERIEFEVAFPELPELERPVAMVEVAGQRRMLVALQDGQVVSFENDATASSVEMVIDLRAQVSRGGNEEGLLGLALAPDFETSGYLYLYYNARPGERRTVLSRFETSGEGADLRADPASELLLLTVPQPYSNHNGGQVAFGPDGMLYLALGDGGSGGDPHGNGQDITRNLLGSIIRFDVSNATAEEPYTIPPDNPFAGQAGVRQEIWAYGLRNPWRFSFDRATGDLWAGDVGQSSREEIDLIVPGGNYGWNIMEGTECFRSDDCDQTGLIAPVADYGRSGGHCSVTGGVVYRGDAVPALRGVYLYADYCSGAMWGLAAEAAAAGEEAVPVQWREEGPNISTFAQDEAGEVYFLAFDGRIYRVTGAG